MACSYAPACKVTLAAKDWAIHIVDCDFQKIKCHIHCGLELIKRDFNNQPNHVLQHNCTLALKNELKAKVAQLKFKKNEVKYLEDVNKVFENTDNRLVSLPIKDSKVYEDKIKLSLSRALHNLTSVAANIATRHGPVHLEHFIPKEQTNTAKYDEVIDLDPKPKESLMKEAL